MQIKRVMSLHADDVNNAFIPNAAPSVGQKSEDHFDQSRADYLYNLGLVE